MASSTAANSSDSATNDNVVSQSCDEIVTVRAAYPGRCRVKCDVDQYEKVITLQPENFDATIKFQLTAAYPSVIPDITIRSESLSNDNIEQIQERLRTKAQELIGKEMIQSLMEEATRSLRAKGMRPGKVKNVHSENFIDDKSKNKKKKNKQKSKSKAREEEEEEDKKLPSMKTAEDVINRIIWDDNLDVDLFLVGYIDRFIGLMEKYFTAFSWEDLATVDYDVLAIPKHRIQYFKYKDVKVWDKTKRMDNVFGSANGTKTIDIVMKEVEEKEQQKNDMNNGATALQSSSDDEDDDSDDEDFLTVTISSSVNIGMPRDGEGDENDKKTGEKSFNPYWTDKLRPNYFICVRITDQNVIDRIVNVQDNVLQHEPLLAECCIPGASLHITISCLGLDTAEQLLQCMEALKKMKPELCSMLPKSSLKLKGVSNFYGRVVYGKVHYEKDFIEFCDLIKLNLQEAGVQIRDGYEFVPHVTLVKITRPVARVRGTKNIDPKYYEQFAETEFGVQKVDSLYLCCMGDERRPDGFYRTPIELHLRD